MTPLLHPLLSEFPVSSSPRPAPAGTFAAARVCKQNPVAPWSAQAPKSVEAMLPKGVIGRSRGRSDMSRHATVGLT